MSRLDRASALKIVVVAFTLLEPYQFTSDVAFT